MENLIALKKDDGRTQLVEQLPKHADDPHDIYDITELIQLNFSEPRGLFTQPVFEKIKKTLNIFIENPELKIILHNLSYPLHEYNNFMVSIMSNADILKRREVRLREANNGPMFSFDQHTDDKSGVTWHFGVNIDESFVTLADREVSLAGIGLGRLLPSVIWFLIQYAYIKIQHFEAFGQDLRIGICGDVSDGFWEYLNMESGRYGEDNPSARHTTRVGAGSVVACAGFDKEFTWRDFGNWVMGIIDRPADKKPLSADVSPKGEKGMVGGYKTDNTSRKKIKKKIKKKKTKRKIRKTRKTRKTRTTRKKRKPRSKTKNKGRKQ